MKEYIDKPYSTAKLMGGLGNQMFQIAHAVCQGWENNVDSRFVPISYTPMNQARQTKHYVNNIFRNINFVDKINKKQSLTEWSWNESNIKPNFNTTIEFNGYFQSSKNFLGHDNKIKDIFKPTETFKNEIYELYPELKNKKTTSIHIRRGDYLTITNVLPVIDISYIKHCMDYFIDSDVFFIFSDDKNWVKENIKNDKVIVVEGLEDYEDLWMMSLCKNHIMSNSSFSWWGSFLNDGNPQVLVPSIWFGPSGPNPYDNIYESNWKKVDVKYDNGSLKTI